MWMTLFPLSLTSLTCVAAIHNFDGKVKWGLPLCVGDTVQIFEECTGE